MTASEENPDLQLPIEWVYPARIRDLDQSALCLGYGKRTETILVQKFGQELNAVFLDGKYAFNSFRVDASLSWMGLIVPDIRFEVDPRSSFDARSAWSPLGALLIGSNGARIQTEAQGGHGFTEKIEIPLSLEVPPIVGELDVGFKKWALIRGEGRDARTLFRFETTAEGTPH